MTSFRVPVTCPARENLTLGPLLADAMQAVLVSGNYILGPEVSGFEEQFSRYIGTDFAIGVANATDAITLTLKALGVGNGHEVITTPLTAGATLVGILNAGAIPVLVDIDPETLCIDPKAVDQAIGPATRAVLPVHLYGCPADLDALSSICLDNSLVLVEDASQAHGAAWNGRKVGSHGDAGIFSFYPTKNLGAIGDGGAITTSNPELAERLKKLRQYGWGERNRVEDSGFNSRLDELQAAILRVKMSRLDNFISERRAIARAYCEVLKGSQFQIQRTPSSGFHAYHLFVIQALDRDGVRQALNDFGIQTSIHYPYLPHSQPGLARRCKMPTSIPVASSATNKIVSLPIFPGMTPDEVDIVKTVISSQLDSA